MRRTLRYLVILVLLFACAGGGVTWWAYDAVQTVRPFYREAMATQPAVLRRAGQELSSRATALVNDAQQGVPWQALFNQEQINGWLAYDLPEKHGDFIPEDVADPRVAIEDGQVKLGVRYSGSRVETVLSVDVEPYLAEPNVVGLRIVTARAGTLPIPLVEVTDRISRAAERFNIPLSWIQESETPTALVTLRLKSARDGQRLQLEALQVSAGEILLKGTTRCEDPEDLATNAESPSAADEEHDSEGTSKYPAGGVSNSTAAPPPLPKN
jgi:hypothetical protein